MPMSFGERVANLFGIEPQIDPQEMLGRFLPPSYIEMIPEADRPALASLARRSALSAYPAGDNPMNAAQKTLVDMIKIGRGEADRKAAVQIMSGADDPPIEQSVLAGPGNETGAPDFRTAASRLEQARQNPVRDQLIRRYQQLQSKGLFDYADKVSEQIKRIDEEYANAEVMIHQGKPIQVRQGKFGSTQILPFAPPPNVGEVSVGDNKYLVDKNSPNLPTLRTFSGVSTPSELVTASTLAGIPVANLNNLTGPQRARLQSVIENIRRSGASNTNVNQNTEKTFFGNLATGVADKITADHAAATAAVSTLGTIADIRGALPNAMTGFGSTTEQILTRVADRLNISSPDAKSRLASTATVIQNMANAELSAAAAMKGQGQITEAERALIKRAAAGDINMSPPEINALINGIEKAARWRIAQHDRNIANLKRNPNSASIADFYQLPPMPESTKAVAPSIENAVDAEIRRRANAKGTK